MRFGLRGWRGLRSGRRSGGVRACLFAAQADKPLTIRARQLYHDREEITVLAMPAG